jgi:methane/ammonia monooxygenase subunit B
MRYALTTAQRWSQTLAVMLLVSLCGTVLAHGERNQEPFLRLRTAHFFDMKWSTNKLAVNDELVVTGKFRLFEDWPNSLPRPDRGFLGNGTPGPVLARVESYIDGVPALVSARLELDRDYTFKTVMKARMPGRHHVHPMVNIESAGPLLGPGNWVEITGNASDFKLPVTTINGTKIDNLETWGVANVVKWHAGWYIAALVFMLWWLRKPLLMTRYRAIAEGKEHLLTTNGDRMWGAAFLVGTLIVVIVGANSAEAKYPRTIPLQGGESNLPKSKAAAHTVTTRVVRSTYDVPGRSMKIQLEITNEGKSAIRVGEFMSANLRFVNQGLPAAVAAVDPGFPKDLMPPAGLKVDKDDPIGPGETRLVAIDMTDAAWEVERLTAMLNDPDNRVGGLLFVFDAEGKRHIANVSGPMVPVFGKGG